MGVFGPYRAERLGLHDLAAQRGDLLPELLTLAGGHTAQRAPLLEVRLRLSLTQLTLELIDL